MRMGRPASASIKNHKANSEHGKPVMASSEPFRKLVCGSASCDANNFVAKTEFEYDQETPASRSGVTGHDDTNYGSSRTNRGNLTSEKVWRNTPVGSQNQNCT